MRAHRDPEVARIARMLKSAILLSEQSQRSIERQMGLSPGYLGRIIDGKLELRIAHILGVCRAIKMPPAAFFLAAYPEMLNVDPQTMRLVQALQHLHRQRVEGEGGKEEAPAPPPPAAAPDRARVEQTMKDFLDVLFGELTRGTPTPPAAAPAPVEPAAPPAPQSSGKKKKSSGG
jgi:transcriptional regulator with XRE-family HTH domain